MIEIKFEPKELSLSITGHAGHGKKGEDIVCAAVSALFYTLGSALDESKEMLEEPPEFIGEEGNGYLKCKPKAEYEGNIIRSYWTILIGLQEIEKAYPEKVCFKVL